MTMIRINLIAERKAGGAKPAKKAEREKSQIEEYAILIGMIIVGLGVVWFRNQSLDKTLNEKQQQRNRLQKEYDNTKHWIDEKENLALQKELLNEKILRIETIKERREEPVRVMEDVYNSLSPQVWLQAVSQGYNANLVKSSGPDRTAYKPEDGNKVRAGTPKDPYSFVVTGYSRSTDAVTNMTDRLTALNDYKSVDLNHLEKSKDGAYFFKLFFQLKKPMQRKKDRESVEEGTP